MNNFKKLLIKYLDSNGNDRLDISEVLYPLVLFFIIDIFAGTMSNFLYDFIKGILK